MNLATHFDRSESANQKEAISGTVCGWHMKILLRILTVQKLSDVNFLGGLASGLLDGFSIGRYEKKREFFDIFPAKLERGAMRFSGEEWLRTLGVRDFLIAVSGFCQVFQYIAIAQANGKSNTFTIN